MGGIDITYDMRTDAKGGDPDRYSRTLRRYHQLLWSKPLPSGAMFDLAIKGQYLEHRSALGEFVLSSDSIIQTYIVRKSMAPITSRWSAVDNAVFLAEAYTIGGMLVFPAKMIDKKLTINAARGLRTKIADRIDLTLECIRRFYLGQTSPLNDVFERYLGFFELFVDFRGYVDFFLLQDLVAPGYSATEFFVPFIDFEAAGFPKTLEEYTEFRHASLRFLRARNARMAVAVP